MVWLGVLPASPDINWEAVEVVYGQMASFLDAIGLLAVVQVAFGAIILALVTFTAINMVRR